MTERIQRWLRHFPWQACLIAIVCSTVCLIWEPDRIHAAPTASANSEHDHEASLALLFSKELGQTLIGEKPISFEECMIWTSPFAPHEREEVVSWLHACFDKSSKYIFKTHSFDPSNIDIFLIHKDAFQRVAAKSVYLRHFVKRHYGTIQNFFDSFKKSKESIIHLFKGDDTALGIALGYGYSNSKFLSRRNMLYSYIHKSYGLGPWHRRLIPGPCIATFMNKTLILSYSIPAVPAPSPGWASIQEELDWLHSIERPIAYPRPPTLFSVPIFVTKQGKKTERLLRKYERGINKLYLIFQKGRASQNIKDFVERTEHLE
jgi:hypothetical protein